MPDVDGTMLSRSEHLALYAGVWNCVLLYLTAHHLLGVDLQVYTVPKWSYNRHAAACNRALFWVLPSKMLQAPTAWACHGSRAQISTSSQKKPGHCSQQQERAQIGFPSGRGQPGLVCLTAERGLMSTFEAEQQNSHFKTNAHHSRSCCKHNR